jgi:hypothetical protein
LKGSPSDKGAFFFEITRGALNGCGLGNKVFFFEAGAGPWLNLPSWPKSRGPTKGDVVFDVVMYKPGAPDGPIKGSRGVGPWAVHHRSPRLFGPERIPAHLGPRGGRQ